MCPPDGGLCVSWPSANHAKLLRPCLRHPMPYKQGFQHRKASAFTHTKSRRAFILELTPLLTTVKACSLTVILIWGRSSSAVRQWDSDTERLLVELPAGFRHISRPIVMMAERPAQNPPTSWNAWRWGLRQRRQATRDVLALRPQGRYADLRCRPRPRAGVFRCAPGRAQSHGGGSHVRPGGRAGDVVVGHLEESRQAECVDSIHQQPVDGLAQ